VKETKDRGQRYKRRDIELGRAYRSWLCGFVMLQLLGKIKLHGEANRGAHSANSCWNFIGVTSI
jgi:hypothetical protein